MSEEIFSGPGGRFKLIVVILVGISLPVLIYGFFFALGALSSTISNHTYSVESESTAESYVTFGNYEERFLNETTLMEYYEVSDDMFVCGVMILQPKSELDMSYIRRGLRESIVAKIGGDEAIAPLRDRGFTFRYDYTDVNGEFVITHIILPYDYKAAAKATPGE